jgi:hypothetical protein
MRSIRDRLLIMFLAMATITAFPMSSQAQGTPPAEQRVQTDADVQISLRPQDGADGDRFEVEVEPGESAEMMAVIQNFGPEPIELRTFTSDVAPMANGGLAVRELDEPQHEPTTWMTYPTETVTLEPGQLMEKPVQVSVPDGTEPGQYVNALILETVNPIPNETPSSFEQYFRKVVAVYITVPGDVEPGFEFGEPFVEVQGTSGLVVVPLHNTGNVRIDLSGSMTVINSSGEVVVETDMRLGPVYGGQETVVHYYLPVLPPEGEYSVSVAFTDATSGVGATSEDLALAMPATDSGEVAPIAFENIVIAPNADPIQFANVTVDITLGNQAFRSTRLTMSVSKDGEVVEDFVLADNLALPQGTTSVQQRYLPLSGWESGVYNFSLTLEDTSSGSPIEIYSESDVATIEVP